MATPPVGILVLDTGYSGPPVANLNVLRHDFSPPQGAFPGIRAGYMPRGDGTDSTPGHGVQAVLTAIQTATPAFEKANATFTVFSVKVGDSGDPLAGVNPVALQPALAWVASLKANHPDWRWVATADWDMTAVGQLIPCFEPLRLAGIPLALPVGAHGSDLDSMISGGAPIASYLPPHILGVAGSGVAVSDYGVRAVGLQAIPPAGQVPAAYVAAWLAYYRSLWPNASAATIVQDVLARATPFPLWSGRSRSGAVLSGPIH